MLVSVPRVLPKYESMFVPSIPTDVVSAIAMVQNTINAVFMILFCFAMSETMK